MSETPFNSSEVHEPLLSLAEKQARGEASAPELAELDRHLAICPRCRDYAAQLQQEQTMMQAEIHEVQAGCDFQRIEHAIVNRRLIERIENRITVVMIVIGAGGAAAAAALGAAAGTIFGFAAVAIGSAIFAVYQWQLKRRWSVLAEQCKSGDPLAFDTFRRSAQSYLALQQFGLVMMIILIPWLGVMGVIKLTQSDWLRGIWFTASALIMVPFLPMLWRRVFSRAARRHEEAVITGEVADTRFNRHSSERHPR